MNRSTHSSPSFAEINTAALSAGLPAQWYPLAQRCGASLRIGNIAGDKGASLWVDLRTGAWMDHATGDKGGDLVSLYAARENISQGEAKTRLAEMLGSNVCPNRNRHNSNSQKALKFWREGQPAEETAAQAYLRRRCISMLSPSIRFHPEAYHGHEKRIFTAMIAAITRWPDKTPHAIHRTFLEGDKKSGIKSPRLMLGPIDGGAVRLAAKYDVLAVAEGIETGLSFQQLTGIPTWAVLSKSNYAGLILPPDVQEIIIAADNDTEGIKAAKEAAQIWAQQGYRVKVLPPEEDGQDWNDVLIQRGM